MIAMKNLISNLTFPYGAHVQARLADCDTFRENVRSGLKSCAILLLQCLTEQDTKACHAAYLLSRSRLQVWHVYSLPKVSALSQSYISPLGLLVCLAG